jgi:MOSC domain-containing protein YiiM
MAELPEGALGENLTVAGADEASVCIGDVWESGTAVLEVSSPRQPCSKIARYWGRGDLLRTVVDRGATGWYLRVLREGTLVAGDGVRLGERPHPEWTVLRAFRVGVARKGHQAEALELSRVAALSLRWKAWLRGEPARV